MVTGLSTSIRLWKLTPSIRTSGGGGGVGVEATLSPHSPPPRRHSIDFPAVHGRDFLRGNPYPHSTSFFCRSSTHAPGVAMSHYFLRSAARLNKQTIREFQFLFSFRVDNQILWNRITFHLSPRKGNQFCIIFKSYTSAISEINLVLRESTEKSWVFRIEEYPVVFNYWMRDVEIKFHRNHLTLCGFTFTFELITGYRDFTFDHPCRLCLHSQCSLSAVSSPNSDSRRENCFLCSAAPKWNAELKWWVFAPWLSRRNRTELKSRLQIRKISPGLKQRRKKWNLSKAAN